jgi:16S rRNA (adenine1518-N6/adenine1519-N6)-dimethyltransferase
LISFFLSTAYCLLPIPPVLQGVQWGAVRTRRRPKLGQHFLRDASYRRRIVEALAILPDDLAVEIGAGQGAMTELLAARARGVVAIEIDPNLVEKLREKLSADPRIEILPANILAIDLAALCRRHKVAQCFVFGNLPYYITSPILHHLFSFVSSLRGMALLVQREVAQRLSAQPGSRDYGYLSVLAQFHSRPRIMLEVPAGAFAPPPKIRSALVDFRMIPACPEGAPFPPSDFLEFVKRCFAQKRKTLLNNLEGQYSRVRIERELAKLGLPRAARAEQLSLPQLISLFRRLD